MKLFLITALLLTFSIARLSTAASPKLLSQVDHVVYGTNDLDASVADLERLLRVHAASGGKHPDGTMNALIALGPHSYLEVLGPDPDQHGGLPPVFGVGKLSKPHLVAWAVKSNDLAGQVKEAQNHGIALGEVVPASRVDSNGVVLTWSLTNPYIVIADGIVPFFIDWGNSPHPSATAAKGVTMTGLRAEHPQASQTEQLLKALDLDVDVQEGPTALILTLYTPNGEVELR